jgi:hypothetical protein
MLTGKISDAGRAESGLIAEKNDCTIRAYAIMKQCSYMQAYGKFYLEGRKPKRRTSVHMEIYDNEFIRIGRPNMTVGRFIQSLAFKGRWIIQVRGHVFAVVDSVIYDTGNPMWNVDRHVIMAWMIKSVVK